MHLSALLVDGCLFDSLSLASRHVGEQDERKEIKSRQSIKSKGAYRSSKEKHFRIMRTLSLLYNELSESCMPRILILLFKGESTS